MDEDCITASAITHTVNVPIVNTYGILAYPRVGDEVILLPVDTGGYVCVGKTLKSNLANPAITLCENGDVLINGVRITKEGAIIQAN